MTLEHVKQLDSDQFVSWVDEHLREEVLFVARGWARPASDFDLYAAWGHVLDKIWSKRLIASNFHSENHLRRHCGQMLKTFLRYGWGTEASKYRHRFNGSEYHTRLLSQVDEHTQQEALSAEALIEIVSTPTPPWLTQAFVDMGEQCAEALVLMDLSGCTRAEAAQLMGETTERVKRLAQRARSVIRAAAPEGWKSDGQVAGSPSPG